MKVDRIFVISLERRPDRWTRIYNQLCSQGLKHMVIRVLATDGQDLPPSVAKKPTGCYFKAGERGCFDSHRKCWELIVSMDCDNALILEDDTDASNMTDVLQQLESTSFDSYNIGAWGHNRLRLTEFGTYVADYHDAYAGCWGANAYTCRKRAAEAFLKGSEQKWEKALDWYISNHPILQQHIAVPGLMEVYWDDISDTRRSDPEPDSNSNSTTKLFFVILVIMTLLYLIGQMK